MKNQLFKNQSELETSKKLDMVLRQLAGDRLTEQQRLQIGEMLGHERQYHLRLCRSKQMFFGLVQELGSYIALCQSTDSDEDPVCIAIQRMKSIPEKTVYIYIPDKEDRRYGPRNKETETA